MACQRPHFILVLCALLAASGFRGLPPAAAAEQAGIQWQHDIESAKATARQTGRLVLVHFWAVGCPPCQSLERNVFNQPNVAAAVDSQFVPVKLNADENPATAMGFGLNRVPTDVILTPDGQVVGKLISPPTPAAYIAEVSQVAAQHASQTEQGVAADGRLQAPPLNAAYANLQIAPNTPSALEAQTARAAADRYPPPVGVGSGGGVIAGVGGVGSASIMSTPAPHANGAAPIIAQPPAAAAASPYDPYAAVPTPALPAAVPQSAAAPAKNQFAAAAPQPSLDPRVNSYTAAPPQAAQQQPVANGYDAVSAGRPAPAHTVNPYAAASPVSTSPSDGGVLPSTAVDPVHRGAASPTSQAMGAASQQPVASTGDVPPLGFEGYCPVSMRKHWKWVPGDPRWMIIHRGRTYYLAGPEEHAEFWNAPDRFSPALSGIDPVLAIDHRQQVPGKREHSLDYDNMFYMFASEATLQQFIANPERYAASVRQALGIEPGRLAR